MRQLSALGLFALTWLGETVVGWLFRALAIAPLVVLAGLLAGMYGVGQGDAVWRWFMYLVTSPIWFPPLFSLIGLLFGGGWLLTRWRLGARPPSDRERQQVGAALRLAGWSDALGDKVRSGGWLPWAVVASIWRRVRRPQLRVYVVDAPTAGAQVIGTTVYVDRELIWSDYLTGVLAHELAHLGLDGRIVLALNRLRLPVLAAWADRAVAGAEGAQLIALADPNVALVTAVGCGCLGLSLRLAIGGYVTSLLAPLWGTIWRQVEFAADRRAHQAGQAAVLVSYLEDHQALDFAVPGLLEGLSKTHPYTEQRLDRLRKLAGIPDERKEWEEEQERRARAVASRRASREGLE